MKNPDPERKRGGWLAWKWAALASLCLAGTLFALDEIFDADADGDGWTDAEEIIAGTDPLDSADPWDSDGDGVPDYLEFANGTDPLDPNDPPRDGLADAASGGSVNALAKRSRGNAARFSAVSAQSRVATLSDGDDSDGDDSDGEGEPEENVPETLTIEGSGAFNEHGCGNITYTYLDKDDVNKTAPPFSKNYVFEIEQGNFVHISLKSDDDAVLSVAGVSAHSYWSKDSRCIIPAEVTSPYAALSDPPPSAKQTVSIAFENYGGPHRLEFTVKTSRVKTEVASVAFVSSGALDVCRDDGDPFEGASWEKDRKNASGADDSTHPVAVRSGSSLRFIPALNSFGGNAPEAVRASVSYPGLTGSVVREISCKNLAQGIEIPAPVPAGTVDYFEKNLTISWSVRYADQTAWIPAGTSVHEIYFTRGEPLTSLRQETLFWISCSGAVRGLSDESAIIDAIWSRFTPLAVTNKRGEKMLYWGPKSFKTRGSFFTAEELIAECDGKCGAWAKFLIACLGLHAVAAQEIKVVPSGQNDDSFFMKNQNFVEPLRSGESSLSTDSDEYVYAWYESIDDYQDSLCFSVPAVYDMPGIPGQQNENPYYCFNNHALARCGNVLYDPSYGKKYCFDSEIGSALWEWSKDAVAGFSHKKKLVLCKDSLSDGEFKNIGRTAVRKYDGASLEVKIENIQ